MFLVFLTAGALKVFWLILQYLTSPNQCDCSLLAWPEGIPWNIYCLAMVWCADCVCGCVFAFHRIRSLCFFYCGMYSSRFSCTILGALSNFLLLLTTNVWTDVCDEMDNDRPIWMCRRKAPLAPYKLQCERESLSVRYALHAYLYTLWTHYWDVPLVLPFALLHCDQSYFKMEKLFPLLAYKNSTMIS